MHTLPFFIASTGGPVAGHSNGQSSPSSSADSSLLMSPTSSQGWVFQVRLSSPLTPNFSFSYLSPHQITFSVPHKKRTFFYNVSIMREKESLSICRPICRSKSNIILFCITIAAFDPHSLWTNGFLQTRRDDLMRHHDDESVGLPVGYWLFLYNISHIRSSPLQNQLCPPGRLSVCNAHFAFFFWLFGS